MWSWGFKIQRFLDKQQRMKYKFCILEWRLYPSKRLQCETLDWWISFSLSLDAPLASHKLSFEFWYNSFWYCTSQSIYGYSFLLCLHIFTNLHLPITISNGLCRFIENIMWDIVLGVPCYQKLLSVNEILEK